MSDFKVALDLLLVIVQSDRLLFQDLLDDQAGFQLVHQELRKVRVAQTVETGVCQDHLAHPMFVLGGEKFLGSRLDDRFRGRLGSQFGHDLTLHFCDPTIFFQSFDKDVFDQGLGLSH